MTKKAFRLEEQPVAATKQQGWEENVKWKQLYAETETLREESRRERWIFMNENGKRKAGRNKGV